MTFSVRLLSVKTALRLELWLGVGLAFHHYADKGLTRVYDD